MFTTDNLNVVLPIIGQGLVGVFIVIGVLALAVTLLNRLTRPKTDKRSKD